MTTLAKVEANKRNSQLSTGPRTSEGKTAVASNAIRHGIYARVPVIPGESPDQWEAHRSGVVESLAPVGLLEVNLAERVALLLWRLQRIARYEAESVAAGIAEVETPPIPPPEDDYDGSPKQKTRDEQLRDTRRELRNMREELADMQGARDFYQSALGVEEKDSVPFGVAESVLEAAYARASEAEVSLSNPPEFESRTFLRRLGQSRSDPRKVPWTIDLIERGLALYATFVRESPEQFRRDVGVEVEEWAEELSRTVRRLEGEAAALARLLSDEKASQRAEGLLPAGGRDERIAKYERHLHNLLTSTLHELERLQARRSGDAVVPPVVADVSVCVDSAQG